MNKRNEVIQNLYNSREFRDIINSVDPPHLRDDLKQECILALYDLPEERFNNINDIRFYVVRIIFNMVSNKNSPFFKKYRQIFIPYEKTFSGVDVSDHYENVLHVEDEGWTAADRKLQCNFELLLNGIEHPNTPAQFRERCQKETFEEIFGSDAMDALNSIYWYNRELIELYVKLGSYREIEKLTHISHVAIYNAVQKGISEVKQIMRAKNYVV